MARIERFEIAIAEPELDDLRARLARVRWPPAVHDAGWSQGVDRGFLERLVDHWRDRFDWRAAERELNRFHHYRIELDGQRVHVVHERTGGLPLLVTHGWPGSFHELTPLVERLTAGPERFDVVVPSLPGYGFSDAPAAAGTDPAAIARLWAALMTELGYPRFGAQGGDWGASVATRLALQEPARVLGLHLNYIPGSYRPDLGDVPASADEAAFLAASDRWWDDEGGYAHVQRTRPDTLGYALDDSPVGLAAWIVDKLRAWSDCDGDVERRFDLDALCTHVSIYWFTRTATSSLRLYREAARNPIHLGPGQRVDVPCGVARFAREAPFPPRSWIERGYRVERYVELPRGGHFAAWEEPDLLADEVRGFFRPLR